MKKIVTFLCCMLTAAMALAEVSAWIDENPVTAGTRFRLYVEAKNVANAHAPDLKGIQGLQLLNRSSQNQTSIVGTSITRTVSWTYVLIAPRAGNYNIPALKIGNEFTLPLEIKAVASASTGQAEAVQMEMLVSPMVVYPQQQIIAKLRIIRNSSQLENESITPLEIAGAQIEKLEQKSYQQIQAGKRQVVTEIIFSIQSETSKSPKYTDELIIPEIKYQGEVLLSGQTRRGGLNSFGFFAQQTKRIYSTSKSKVVKIKAMPNGFKGWWLPASNLEMDEEWQPNPPVFRVGEPVTRTVTIRAKGVSGNQIPELSFEFNDSIKGYADQPKINTEKKANGVIGIRQEKWAIIPGQAGELKLPGVTIAWWDVESDQYKTTELPARTIDVLPAIGATKKNSVVYEPQAEEPRAAIRLSETSANPQNESFLWQVVSVIFALLWFGTLFLLFQKNKSNASKEDSIKQELKNLKILNLKQADKKVQQALKSADPSLIRDALLLWGKSFWQENPPMGLEQISERLPQLEEGIKSLNNQLYGTPENEKSVEQLQMYFNGLSSIKHYDEIKNSSPLSSLHPESK